MFLVTTILRSLNPLCNNCENNLVVSDSAHTSNLQQEEEEENRLDYRQEGISILFL